MLSNAFGLSMTRNTGGVKFVERRDFPEIAEESFKLIEKQISSNLIMAI
jgi:hypothetical protein